MNKPINIADFEDEADFSDCFNEKTSGENEGGKADGWPFRITKDGVQRRIDRQDTDTKKIVSEWRWICSILEVIAETRDTDGEEWGRLLMLKDRDGRKKDWAMPMAMLATDGSAYRERLLSLGLILAPGRFAREALHEYISTARPGTKARCVARVGWSAGAFVLPSETFGDFQP